MKKKGLTLIEILVASVTLILVVTSSAVTFSTVRKLSRRFYFRYTAINLAKDVLEFGEAAILTNALTMRYEYSPSSSGYRVTSCTGIDLSGPDPFDYIGDIKARGLIPADAPDSVVISYNATNEAAFYGALVQTVRVAWKEDASDPEQKVLLGVLPIRQVNDQLQLRVGEFLWN